MSEGLVSDCPLVYYLDALTGSTVRGGHTIARATSANVAALGRPAKRVGPTQGLAAPGSVTVGYVRSHASIRALYVAWYYRPDPDPFASTLATIGVTLTISDAAGHTITAPDATIPRPLGGATYTAARVVSPDDSFLGGSGYLDLDAVAAVLTDPNWSLTFAWTRSGSNVTLDHIEGVECGRTSVSDADAFGALVGPFNPGNPIIAGTVASIGYERLAKTLEAAVACNRALLSVAWPLDVGVAPGLVSGSFTAFARMLEGGSTPWPWRVTVRALYAPASATGEPHRARFLYQVTDGGTAAIRTTVVDSGSTYDAAGLTASSWAWSPWVDLMLPTDVTACSVTFTGKTTAGVLSLAAIQVDEAQ